MASDVGKVIFCFWKPRIKQQELLSIVQSPRLYRHSGRCLSGKKCLLVFRQSLLFVPIASSCHWALVKTAWLHPLCILLTDVLQEPPELSFVWAEQSQFSWPFLIEEVFQSRDHPDCPSLDFLNYVHVLRSPELVTALQVWQRGRITCLDLLAAALL